VLSNTGQPSDSPQTSERLGFGDQARRLESIAQEQCGEGRQHALVHGPRNDVRDDFFERSGLAEECRFRKAGVTETPKAKMRHCGSSIVPGPFLPGCEVEEGPSELLRDNADVAESGGCAIPLEAREGRRRHPRSIRQVFERESGVFSGGLQPVTALRPFLYIRSARKFARMLK
jgi:hypothetical protein